MSSIQEETLNFSENEKTQDLGRTSLLQGTKRRQAAIGGIQPMTKIKPQPQNVNQTITLTAELPILTIGSEQKQHIKRDQTIFQNNHSSLAKMQYDVRRRDQNRHDGRRRLSKALKKKVEEKIRDDEKKTEETKKPEEAKKPEEEKKAVTGFADDVLKQHEDVYSRKFKFEKAQFTQCIANPAKQNELITVQLAQHLLKEAGNRSIDDMQKENEEDLQYQRLYKRYMLEDHKDKKKQSDERDLEAVSKDSAEIYYQMKQVETDEANQEVVAHEIAIIGFWKRDEMNQFQCYSHFRVKNPLMRDSRNLKPLAQQSKLNQVLFLGHKDEVFFFYKETLDKKSDIMLGILNSEIEDDSSASVNFDDYNEESFKSFNINPESMLHEFIKTTLSGKPTEELVPNPVLITVDDLDFLIVFTAHEVDKKAKAPVPTSIFFYDVDTKKETIRIPDGVVFLKFDQQTNEVVYLARDTAEQPKTNLIKYIKTRKLPKLDPKSDIHICRFREITKKYNLRFDKESTKLQGWNKSLANVIEGQLHNDDSRLTIVFREQYACTFSLPVLNVETNDLHSEETPDAPRIFRAIQDSDLKIVRQNGERNGVLKDVFVQANLKSHQDDEDLRLGNSFATASLKLYKVSGKLKGGHELKIPHFQLNQSFARSQMGNSNNFIDVPASIITPSGEIIGAVLYEEQNEDQITLNWFFAKLEQENGESSALEYPQMPLSQTKMIDYPILAYKCMSPDNKEISVVHLSQNMPQRKLHLGAWEFISFVQGGNERDQADASILILVKSKYIVRLMMIRLDPWKRLDINKVYNEPEAVFMFIDDVRLPYLNQEQTLLDQFKESLFAADKIENVLLLTNKVEKIDQIVLSIQYRHCILTTSLKTKKHQILIESPQMIKKNQVRGNNDTVFYAKNAEEKDVICQMKLSNQILDKVVIQEIFDMEFKLIAMEADRDYKKMKQKKQEEVLQINILNSDLVLQTIKQQDNPKKQYTVEKKTDFSEHQLDHLIESDWERVHLSHKAITMGAIIYKANQDEPETVKGSKMYNWSAKCHTSNTKVLRNHKTTVFNVEHISQSSCMVATVEQEHTNVKIKQLCRSREAFFIVRPGPGVRKQHLTRFETKVLISNIVYVSNNHSLVQFSETSVPSKKDDQVTSPNGEPNKAGTPQTAIFKPNGMIVNQSEEVYKLLQGQIVGESQSQFGKKNKKAGNSQQFHDGKKTIVIRKISACKQTSTVSVLRFDEDGICRDHNTFDDFEGTIIAELNGKHKPQIGIQFDEEKHGKLLAFANEILVTDEGNLVIIGRQRKIIDPQTVEEIKKEKDKKKQEEVARKFNLKTPTTAEVYKINNFYNEHDFKVQMQAIIMTQVSPEPFQPIQVSPEPVQPILPAKPKSVATKSKPPEEVLKQLQFELTGSYFVCKSKMDNMVRIFSTDTENSKNDKNGCFIDKIDLQKMFIQKTDNDYVNIHAVPKSAFTNVKYLQNEKIKYHGDLLQIVIKNKSIVFDLNPNNYEGVKRKQKEPQEVNFLDNFSQLMNPETLVNTGLVHSEVLKPRGKENSTTSKMITAQMNGIATQCFMKLQEQKTVGSLGQKDQTIVVKNLNTELDGIIYRTYSEVDLLDLAEIKMQHDNKEMLHHIDVDTLLSTYEGHTVFSIYYSHLDVYEKIAEQFHDYQFEDENDQRKVQENSVYRRLYRILKMPTSDLKPKISLVDPTKLGTYCSTCQQTIDPKGQAWYQKATQCVIDIFKKNTSSECNTQCRGFKSIALKSVTYNNEKYRDCLIRLSCYCLETEISLFVNAFDDLKALFDHPSPHITSIIENCHFETSYSKKVTVMKMTVGSSARVIRSNISYFDQKYLETLMKKGDDNWILNIIIQFVQWFESIKNEGSTQNVSVDVKMLKTSWIFRNREKGDVKTLQEFVETLANLKSDQMLQSDLVFAVVEEFWSHYKYVLFIVGFIPFLAYFICVIKFFTINLGYDIGLSQEAILFEEQEESLARGFQVAILISGTIYFSFIESLQMAKQKLQYIIQPRNWIDIGSTFIVVIFLYQVYFGEPLQREGQNEEVSNQNVWCVLGVGLMWFKLFKWVRLSSELSTYTKLLGETFHGVFYFMILFIMVISMFANMMFILNETRIYTNTKPLFSRFIENNARDAWVHQYLLALGEFGGEIVIEGENQGLLWVIFICSTFVIQITFLNMLIAIMSDTFDKVKENSKLAKMKEKIDILNEFQIVMRWFIKEPPQYFLIVQSSNTAVDGIDEWDGKVAAIKAQINKNYKQVMDQQDIKFKLFGKRISKLNDNSRADIKHLLIDSKQSRKHQENMFKEQEKMFKATKHGLSQVESTMKEELHDIQKQINGMRSAQLNQNLESTLPRQAVRSLNDTTDDINQRNRSQLITTFHPVDKTNTDDI